MIKILKEKNIELRNKILNNTIDSFSDESIKKRKKCNILIRKTFKLFSLSYNVKVVKKFKAEEGKKYIFTSSHSYEDDILLNVVNTKAHMYILMGGSDQVIVNPLMPATVLNGVVFLNTLNKSERKNIKEKLIEINKKTNLLIFFEGAYNDSENKLHLGIFRSIYDVSCNTKNEVVPMVNIKDIDKKKFRRKKVFIDYAESIKAWNYTYEEFEEILSEKISTLTYNILENHQEKLNRDLYQDISVFHEKRYKEYSEDDTVVGWTENFLVKTELDKYEYSDFISDMCKIHDNCVNPNSLLGKETEYFDKHNFKKFVERKTGFTINVPTEDKIFLISKKIKKLYTAREDAIKFCLESMLYLNEEDFNYIYNYLLVSTNNLDVEDAIIYVFENFLLSLNTKENVLYELNENLMYQRKRKSSL